MNIKISNIGMNTTDSDLRRLFFQYGKVDSASVNRNPLNGRPLKTGEVSMPVPAQARQAIVSLDRTFYEGKMISVSEVPAELY
jgi:RNA recognition motif-containing protein